MAVAPGGARGPRCAARRAAAGRAAGVFRGADPQRDRPADGPAARHGKNQAAARAPEADRGAPPPQGLAGMTDWLGMAADPRAPPPELKARVLARARAGPPRRWWLAAAALLVLAVGGAYWSYRTVTTLRGERGRVAGVVASLRDSLALVNSASAKVVWIPVTTGGRVGGVTIFADSLRHRWLVRCDGLTRNADRKSTRLNSSHGSISYAVFCLKKKKNT